MLREVILFNLLLCPFVISKRRHRIVEKSNSDELGSSLVTALRDDKNLDLSMDEEYEDLRAELLAYHTALSSLTGSRADDPAEAIGAVSNTRRSMKTTPCWKLGGICVKNNLCKDTRFLTEVPGCKSKLEVCCFTWNKFETRDLKDEGIGNSAFPWSQSANIGGRGLIAANEHVETRNSHENVYNIPIIFAEARNKRAKRQHENHDAPVLVIIQPNTS